MKEGWRIRKMGEVCTSDLGKTLNQAKDTGELMPYLCSINVQWDRIDLSTVKQARFERADYERFSVRQGDLLVCEGGDIGRAAIWESETPMLYQNALHRVRFRESILPRYCLRYLQHLKLTGVLDQTYGKGVTIKHLVKSSLFSIPIPVPPITEQEKIVAELDCLTGIIEKKKQQLEELDKLAQSIFYDMFGDPITNEKGWEMKRLEDISSLITDGSHYSPQNDENGDIPMLSVKDMQQTRFSYDACKWIGREEYAKLLANGCKPLKNDVLIAKDGSFFKYIFVLTEEREQAILSSIAILRPKTSVVNPRFVSGYLSTAEVFSKVEREYLTGTAIKRVILKGIRRMPIILPPLSNQNEFAKKIEAIEKQKELVKQSIVETETLFNSRMDFWFNN